MGGAHDFFSLWRRLFGVSSLGEVAQNGSGGKSDCYGNVSLYNFRACFDKTGFLLGMLEKWQGRLRKCKSDKKSPNHS